MSRCRFLIDQCVASSLARGLRRRLPEVSVIQVGPNLSLGQILDDLTLIYEASEDSEWIDVLRYLPLSA
jgi:hypothetical protein